MSDRQREFLRRKFAREAVARRSQGDTISRLRLQGVSEEILSRIELGAGNAQKKTRRFAGDEFQDEPDFLDEN